MKKPRALPFNVWKQKAQKHADKLEVIAGDVLFDDIDSYGVKDPAEAAFKAGQDPRAFVEEMFEEDIARNEHDNLQYAESLEAQMDE